MDRWLPKIRAQPGRTARAEKKRKLRDDEDNHLKMVGREREKVWHRHDEGRRTGAKAEISEEFCSSQRNRGRYKNLRVRERQNKFLKISWCHDGYSTEAREDTKIASP
jgi:hypothetical protein